MGLWSFALDAKFTWSYASDCHFFKHLKNFLQRKHFHNQEEAENAF